MNHSRKRHGFNPPVGITDDDGYLSVTIELPGITEEQIRIDLEKTILTVSVSADEKLKRKIIHVPPGVRLFRKKFSSGILEILLEKPAA